MTITSSKKADPKVDEAVNESFPASDPPSFMGAGVAGAPNHAGKKSAGEHSVVTGNVSIDLNKASAEKLGSLPALGPDLVKAILDSRPLTSWEDLKALPGFDGETIAALRKGGAYIGY